MNNPSAIKENKVLSILKTFTRKDLRLFGRFIRSPYFNWHPEVATFYSLIMEDYPAFSSPQLEKRNIFKKLYPGRRFDDKTVRYQYTDLARLLEKYLVSQQIETNSSAFTQHLLEAHRQRNNISQFRRLFLERASSTELPPGDSGMHYHRFAASESYLNFLRPTESRKKESNIGQVMKSLDIFYISKKLELSCEMENAKSLLDKTFEPYLLGEITRSLEEHPYSQEAAVGVYLDILKIRREPEDETTFERFLKRLKDDEHSYTKPYLRELYQYALNFCIKKINSGRPDYHLKIFDIYKIILANGVLMQNGTLSQWDYKNIVTVSLRLKNFQWAKSFIHEFKNRMPEAEMENAFNYNMANYYFRKNEFAPALKLLKDVEFSDPVYQLDSRAMLLKIYAEQDDLDALYYHFKAFRTFLERNTLVSKFHKTLYGNLIRYTKKMVEARGNKKATQALRLQLEDVTQVADLQWLISQLSL